MPAKRLSIVLLIALVGQLSAATRLALAQEDRNTTTNREAARFDKLRADGKFQEAEAYLKYRQKGDGQYQYFFLSFLVDLYIQLDRTPEALPLADEAVIGCKKHYGPKHGMTGKATMRLGRVNHALNQLELVSKPS